MRTAISKAARAPGERRSDLIESLADEWDQLAARVGAGPFVRPGWFAAWWNAFGAGDLEIRTVRNDGRLTAVLPVARHRGALRSLTNGHTPQFGILAENDGAAIGLAETIFREEPNRVSLAAMEPDGSSVKACQVAAEDAGYRVAVRPFQRSPYLEIRETWREYESRLSRNLLDDLRKSQRRLSRCGKVFVDIHDGRERLPELLADAFRVEASSWKGTEGTAIQSHPETTHFYTDVAQWAVVKGMFRLFILRLDQRPLAMLYALDEDGICHFLKAGYDPEFARFSPGKLLMRAAISYCFEGGRTKIEFHGHAEPYKLCWASGVREQKRFEAFSYAPGAQAAWLTLAYARPLAGRVLRSFRRLARR